MSHAVVHFEIGGPDAKALEDFYGKLFGWTIDSDNPMEYPMVFKMENGVGGGLPKTPDGKPSVTFYVTCGDDVAGKLAEAQKLGATVVQDVMDVPGGGPTIALFADPDGNRVGLVNGSPDDEAPMQGKGNPVVWFEIGCSDPDKGHAFYKELFGWTINADNPMKYGEVSAIGNGIGGGVGPAPQGPYTTLYVQVDDLSAALKKAEELGGKTINEPMDVPGGPTLAHFGDPAGNFVGLLLAGSGSG